MKKSKYDILCSLLAIWGLILFMVLFSLAGAAFSYSDYAEANREEGTLPVKSVSVQEDIEAIPEEPAPSSFPTDTAVLFSVLISFLSFFLTVFFLRRYEKKNGK